MTEILDAWKMPHDNGTCQPSQTFSTCSALTGSRSDRYAVPSQRIWTAMSRKLLTKLNLGGLGFMMKERTLPEGSIGSVRTTYDIQFGGRRWAGSPKQNKDLTINPHRQREQQQTINKQQKNHSFRTDTSRRHFGA